MKTIERTDAAAFEWRVGSIQTIEGEAYIVTEVKRGQGARVRLAERDEWLLHHTTVSPWLNFNIGHRQIRSEPGMSTAEFLRLIRGALLAEALKSATLRDVEEAMAPLPVPDSVRAKFLDPKQERRDAEGAWVPRDDS